MASNYAGFPVTTILPDGTIEALPGVDVVVVEEGEVAIAESPLTTNADGEIEAGTFASVPVGTVVHFSYADFGVADSCSQTTT